MHRFEIRDLEDWNGMVKRWRWGVAGFIPIFFGFAFVMVMHVDVSCFAA